MCKCSDYFLGFNSLLQCLYFFPKIVMQSVNLHRFGIFEQTLDTEIKAPSYYSLGMEKSGRLVKPKALYWAQWGVNAESRLISLSLFPTDLLWFLLQPVDLSVTAALSEWTEADGELSLGSVLHLHDVLKQ